MYPSIDRIRNLSSISVNGLTFSSIIEESKNSNKKPIGWARYSDNGYEVSTKGDRRFSSFCARIRIFDGRTIESIYQLNIKGYHKQGIRNPLEVKGLPPIGISYDEAYVLFKKLWAVYCLENKDWFDDLRKLSDGKMLTDKFASTKVSQARALYEILIGDLSSTTHSLSRRLAESNFHYWLANVTCQ